MYNNIGSKIKGLAKVMAVIQAALFIIVGIRMIKNSRLLGTDGVLIGVGFIVLGPVVAWASSLLLYGLGELIETNIDIRNRMCMSNHFFVGNAGGATPPAPHQVTTPHPPVPSQAVAPQQAPVQDQAAPTYCKVCGKPWVSGAQTCLGCGATRD